MACTRFFYALLLISTVRTGHSFLVTRLKNPNEYVAKDDFSDLDGLDEKTYQNLLEELPELKDILKYRRTNLPIQEFDNISDHYKIYQNYPEFEDKEELFNATLEEYDLLRDYKAGNLSSTTDSPKMRFITRWPQPSNTTLDLNKTRKWFLPVWNPYVGPRRARCYWCGLNQSGIPRSSLCHDMFDSQDFRARRMARYFRAHCHENTFHGWAYRKKPWRERWNTYEYTYQAGLINQYYGWFVGGCFKRFLDVGTVYTQRGCRSWHPRKSWHIYGQTQYGSGWPFAGHRFSAMETPYRYQKKDICIVSPHASLTPFHRSISLWVRYHVCLCFEKWCNSGVKFGMSSLLMFSNFALVIIYNIVM